MQLYNDNGCIGKKKMGEDLRTIKTQQNIQSHFLKLLETYNFKDITIKSLINECKINRSTFYRNYEDKYDLIYKITEELITKFKKILMLNLLFLISKKRMTLSHILSHY